MGACRTPNRRPHKKISSIRPKLAELWACEVYSQFFVRPSVGVLYTLMKSLSNLAGLKNGFRDPSSVSRFPWKYLPPVLFCPLYSWPFLRNCCRHCCCSCAPRWPWQCSPRPIWADPLYTGAWPPRLGQHKKIPGRAHEPWHWEARQGNLKVR